MLRPGKPRAPEITQAPQLTPDEKLQFDAGKRLFLGICATCNQPHSTGMEGLPPPLVDTDE